MKANEFVRKYGIDGAKAKVDQSGILSDLGDKLSIFDEDLKRIVESHELVESCGGLHPVGEKLTHGMYESRAVIDRLKLAIADVDSCQ